MSRCVQYETRSSLTTRRGGRRGRPRRVAMTLLEVILAIAILGGSLAALGEVVRAGTRAARGAKLLSTAQLLADSLTAEICISTVTPEAKEGIVDDFGGMRWAYTVQVEQVQQQGLLGIIVSGAGRPGRVPTAGLLLAGPLDDRPSNGARSGSGRGGGRGGQ